MASKPWSHLFDYLAEGGPDYRFGGPTTVCLCGGNMFAIFATFDDSGALAGYLLDARCASCGAHIIAPTEIDERSDWQ